MTLKLRLSKCIVKRNSELIKNGRPILKGINDLSIIISDIMSEYSNDECANLLRQAEKEGCSDLKDVQNIKEFSELLYEILNVNERELIVVA